MHSLDKGSGFCVGKRFRFRVTALEEVWVDEYSTEEDNRVIDCIEDKRCEVVMERVSKILVSG